MLPVASDASGGDSSLKTTPAPVQCVRDDQCAVRRRSPPKYCRSTLVFRPSQLLETPNRPPSPLADARESPTEAQLPAVGVKPVQRHLQLRHTGTTGPQIRLGSRREILATTPAS